MLRTILNLTPGDIVGDIPLSEGAGDLLLTTPDTVLGSVKEVSPFFNVLLAATHHHDLVSCEILHR